ncbi:helix-turn-helix domain-containing protein [Mahella australiensis]|uniref:Helix-turn-helix domain protein n=1 Tax=Mahella australiensis (strain DSM 15567 / CIP 107919 / 50-1 BON) TaxID=697281 RepID=F3ZWZ3_MAHA5|nr:helix-turn-helix transcriptional regulator [Mahella australiensis]AEE97615.1 helix-turn-helix domain protein [Mahella australiensis 50-1 BON]
MSVGERLKQLRQQRKLTLRDLSQKAGISISFLSDIENGRSNPSLKRLSELAEVLGTTVSYLLGEDEPNIVSDNNTAMEIANRLKELRKQRKWSVAETAEKLGLSEQYYHDLEEGNRQPDIKLTKKLADIFNVSADYLIGRINVPNSYIPEEYAQRYPVTKRDLSQYEDFIEHIDQFFMNDDVPEDDKETLFRDISELFWMSREKDKQKYRKEKRTEGKFIHE